MILPVMTSTHSSTVCEPRWATPRTASRRTRGHEAAAIAKRLGAPLMPWQRQVVDVALELTEDGLPAFREIRVTVPRQQGKTLAMLSLMVHRCVMWGETPQRVMYSAQTGKDAREKMLDDFAPAIERSALKSTLRRVNRGMGNESINFRSGSFVKKLESSDSSGHGKTNHQAIIDEAFKDVDARREQALVPSMSTVADAQLFIISTAGTAASSYLWEKVESGRQLADAGRTDGIAYFEWSAPDDADADDPATWRECMPALNHTINEAVVRHARESLSDSEFRRAYLNQWTAQQVDSVIPGPAWSACFDASSSAGDRLVFAADVTPDRSASSIAVASVRADGLTHLEVVEHAPGTAWLASRAAELVGRWSGSVLLDAGGPAGSLVHDLAARGVPVSPVSGADVGRACGWLLDQVLAGRVRHIGQRPLDVAVEAASRLTMGDAWRWSRRSSSVDISPLVACTLALWGVTNQAPTPVEFFAY